MRFIEMSGFCVRNDRQVAFQEWVVANQERIKQAYPEGSEFGGIYAAVYTTDKEGGDTYWLEFHDSYAALDRAAAVQKDPTSEMAKIIAGGGPVRRPGPPRGLEPPPAQVPCRGDGIRPAGRLTVRMSKEG